jgi:amino acid transporter
MPSSARQVGEMAVARILTMVGREHLMPGFFAYINPRLGTPLIATITLGVLTALIALVTAFDDLANLVAICTLFVFW